MAFHLVTFMNHRLNLLAKVTVTAGEEDAQKMLEATVKCFQNKFRSYKPSFEETEALQQQLEDATALPEATKTKMLNVLHLAEVAPASTGESGVRGGSQTRQHFFNYLTQADWDALAHPELATANKIAVLANRMSPIGLLWPSEKDSRTSLGRASRGKDI